MTSGERASRREDVVRILGEADAPLTIVEVAKRLGAHPNTARFHLDRLVSTGRVERTVDDRGLPGRPAQLFRLAEQADRDSARRYGMLAEVLVDQLAETRHPAAHAVEAGRAWGSREARVRSGREGSTDDVEAALIEMMTDIGFAPEREGGAPDAICARRCPFRDLARREPSVVCSIHLGLIEGALSTWDPAVTVDRFERRADAQHCVVHLARPSAPTA